jgi:hypothetical protein
LVLLPSGKPAKLLEVVRKNDQVYGRVLVRNGKGMVRLQVSLDALVSFEHQRMASV